MRHLILLVPFALAAHGCENNNPIVPVDMGQYEPNTMAVVTTSSIMTSGALHTVRLADQSVTRAIDATLDEDHVVRGYGGKVYVLDRRHGSLRIYDPAAGFRYLTTGEIATGDTTAPHENSNPHDVFPMPGTSKIYVALYDNDASHSLGVLDSAHPDLGVVKWIPLPKASSSSPRAHEIYYCAPYLYVMLQDLDGFTPTGPGRIAVVDPATDALVSDGQPSVIQLAGENPGGMAPLDPASGSCDVVLIADTGDYGKEFPAGGGIELVDLTLRESKDFLLTDSDMNGRPSTVSIASTTLAFTVAINPDFTSTVVAFDPTEKKVLGAVLGPAQWIAFAAVSPDGKLFAGVANSDTTMGQPAVGLYVAPAASTKMQVTPIDLGQAPYGVSFY